MIVASGKNFNTNYIGFAMGCIMRSAEVDLDIVCPWGGSLRVVMDNGLAIL